MMKRIISAVMVMLILVSIVPSAVVNTNAAVAKNTVTYLPYAIKKGNYSTTIWDQHTIWKNGSSAANHGCGICVTAMALRLSGVNSNPNTVLKETNRSVKKCKPLTGSQATKYIKSKGINATCYNSKKYTQAQCGMIIQNALNSGKIVMAVTNGAPFSTSIHWILLTGYTTDGKIVVANSSYGYKKICRTSKAQYQLVTLDVIQKALERRNTTWSNFIVVTPKTK